MPSINLNKSVNKFWNPTNNQKFIGWAGVSTGTEYLVGCWLQVSGQLQQSWEIFFNLLEIIFLIIGRHITNKYVFYNPQGQSFVSLAPNKSVRYSHCYVYTHPFSLCLCVLFIWKYFTLTKKNSINLTIESVFSK